MLALLYDTSSKSSLASVQSWVWASSETLKRQGFWLHPRFFQGKHRTLGLALHISMYFLQFPHMRI